MNLLTNVEADALLYMPKRIVVNDEMKDEFMFSFADKIKLSNTINPFTACGRSFFIRWILLFLRDNQPW